MDNTQKFTTELEKAGISYKIDAPLKSFTTWKIGGPADVLVEVTQKDELIEVVKIARAHNVPITILGSGSNVLISDEGIRGIVIINRIEYLIVADENITHSIKEEADKIQARLDQVDKEAYYDFEELDYDESDRPQVLVTVSSGYYLPKLINASIAKGATGLQWFAGIPGTLGGAVYNNIHGGSHFLSEFVKDITVLDENNEIKTLQNEELGFEYDSSNLHNSKNIILEVKLTLYKGDPKRALKTAIGWAQKKRMQPYNSAGCCFKNITATEMERLNLLSSSWGYIIDKILALKGITAGGAKISERHAAFIENTGNATADDVLDLFDLIYSSAKDKLGITPKPEIFLLGFSREVINKYV